MVRKGFSPPSATDPEVLQNIADYFKKSAEFGQVVDFETFKEALLRYMKYNTIDDSMAEDIAELIMDNINSNRKARGLEELRDIRQTELITVDEYIKDGKTIGKHQRLKRDEWLEKQKKIKEVRRKKKPRLSVPEHIRAGNPVKSYERSRPRRWLLEEKRFITIRKNLPGSEIAKRFVDRFPNRTKSSILTQRARLKKKGWIV